MSAVRYISNSKRVGNIVPYNCFVRKVSTSTIRSKTKKYFVATCLLARFIALPYPLFSENIISIFFPSLESSISIDLSKEFSTIIILILFEISLIKLVNFFLLLCETMTIVILLAKFIIFYFYTFILFRALFLKIFASLIYLLTI